MREKQVQEIFLKEVEV